MEKVLEIYRPILGSGAEELSDYARVVAKELNIVGELTTLHWGNSPRIKILTQTGSLAERLYDENYSVLLNAIKVGANAQTMELKDWTLWGWDLQDTDPSRPREAGPNPSIQLAAKLSKRGPRSTVISGALAGCITESLLLVGLRGKEIPKRLPEGLMQNIEVVGFGQGSELVTRQDVDGKRDFLNPLAPKLDLGPVSIELVEDERGVEENYGFLVGADF